MQRRQLLEHLVRGRGRARARVRVGVWVRGRVHRQRGEYGVGAKVKDEKLDHAKEHLAHH